MTVERFDAIVLGAGGAGLMAASVAGQRGRRVIVLDHNDEPGRKILISGGGRCNFTNLGTVPERYLSANPHFAKSALGRYAPADFVALVERHGIAWHEKTLGQLFCDGSAAQIVAMLMDECAAGGVAFSLGGAIGEVDHADGLFRVTQGERVFCAPALVIACGGPSIPKLGATGFAYDLARRFGLKVVEPRPALVPLTLPGSEALFRSLSGVAAPVVMRAGKAEFAEAALFTHRGLSGPAVLQVSSYWRHGEAVDGGLRAGSAEAGWLLAAKRARPKRVPAVGAALARAAGGGAGGAAGGGGTAGGLSRCRADGGGAGAGGVAVPARWHGGVRQGRSDGGRHRHRRAVVADDGGARRAGAVCDRRGGGRDGVARGV